MRGDDAMPGHSMEWYFRIGNRMGLPFGMLPIQPRYPGNQKQRHKGPKIIRILDQAWQNVQLARP